MAETATFNNVKREEIDEFLRILLGLREGEEIPWDTTGWDKAEAQDKTLRMLEMRIDYVMLKFFMKSKKQDAKVLG